MIKVLLVDDEPIIAKGLRKLISWESLNCEIAGEAYDGEEALEFILENKPDIVITDLLMPIMDGMELVKRIYEDGIPTKVIILSGHGEFEYARNALKYGVFEYLLKPVTREQLTETMTKVLGKIKTDIKSSEIMERVKAQWRESLPLLRDKLVLDVIKGEMKDSELISKKAQLLDMDFSGSLFTVFALEIDNLYDHKQFTTAEDRIILKFAAENIAGEVINRRLAGYTTGSGDILHALIFIRGQDFSNGLLFAVADEIRRCMLEYMDTPISIGMGRLYTEITDAAKSCDEADKALKSKLLFADANIIHINNILPTSKNCCSYPEEAEKKVLDSVIYGSEPSSGKLAEYLAEYFVENSGRNTELVHSYCREFMIQLDRSLRMLGCNSEVVSGTKVGINVIMQFKSMQDLKQWLSRAIDHARVYVSDMRKNREYDAIQEARNYIDGNFSEDLTLNRVAGKVYMSPTYFSALFKNRTGVNFCDYLLKVRMDNAARMLSDNSYKTYEVSEMAGYKNPRYFSDAFRRYHGLTPTEFREKNRNLA